MKDAFRDLLDKAEPNAGRWLLVALGVVILLRLRLILFAAALPVMAYWHYSNQQEADDNGAEQDGETHDGADGQNDDSAWPAGDDDEEPDFDDSGDRRKQDRDPYDQSFWGGQGSGPKTGAGGNGAPWRSPGNKPANRDMDGLDDLGLDDLDGPPRKPNGNGVNGKNGMPKKDAPWDDDDDFGGLGGGGLGGGGLRPGGNGSRPGGGGGGGFGSLGDDTGGDIDFGFLGGGGDDMDALFGGGFGGGKSKGKGKSKDKDKNKDPMAPREPNPKQVFVANVGDMSEDELREFFEKTGDVDRMKVLRNPDGSSKGVCFVTFGTVEQAQEALSLHGSSVEGRSLVVRLAHGGNKGEKGDKGGGKGGDRFGGDDRGPVDLGGAERFGAAFGDRGDRDRDRGFSGGSGGKGGRGKGEGRVFGRRNDRNEMDDILEEELSSVDGPVKPADFDFAARRFLAELRSKDRSDGTTRFQEAIDMVLKYTSSKDRSSVRKWPAYIFTLLQKFDPNLWEELRERDAERRQQKGASKGGGGSGGGAFERRKFGDDDTRNERDD